jgi:membrane associated rhomboid family serine protease
MLPIRDHNPSGKFPFVTYVLIVLNVLVFFFMFSLSENMLEEFINSYSVISALVIKRKGLLGLFTALFLHGSLGHLLGNMLFLNIFGHNLEDKLGHLKYLVFYFLCGLGASFLQILVDPNSQIPMLGASGAIAGVMGGYLLLFPQHKIDVLYSFGFFVRRTSVPAYLMLFYWILAQFIYGVGSLGMAELVGVAYFAHIGGFLVGILMVSLLRKRVVRPLSF